MVVTAGGSTPEEILRATQPLDDAGAATADRYEWQAMMATADILAIYFESLDEDGRLIEGAHFSVICEHHEDWSVAADGKIEIVSGKHREASTGPFSTYRQVLDGGGVRHLLDRWKALGQTPMCRLVTTGGLSDECAKTARACDKLRNNPDSVDNEVLEVIAGVQGVLVSMAAVKGEQPPSPEPADVIRRFLAMLRFQDAQPRRDLLPDMAGERYGKHVAERLGKPQGGIAAWHAVLALVRPRMRDAGPSLGGALPTVLGVEHDEFLASRTLTIDDVDMAVRFALENIQGYVQLPRVIKANRMAVKMTQGGCSDNSVERADELRLQYRQYWRARRSNPNTTDMRRRLDNLLQTAIDEATDAVRSDVAPWGAQLWRLLGERFLTVEGQPSAQGLSAELLLGGVSELANNCRAWYTDRFDAEAMLRQLIAAEAAS